MKDFILKSRPIPFIIALFFGAAMIGLAIIGQITWAVICGAAMTVFMWGPDLLADSAQESDLPQPDQGEVSAYMKDNPHLTTSEAFNAVREGKAK